MNASNTNKLSGSILAGIAAIGCMTAVSSGDIIQARFDSVSPSQSVKYSTNGGDNYSTTTAGSFNWTRMGGDYAGPGADGSFLSYCIELSQHISYGQTYSYETRALEASPQPGAGMGIARANLLRELWGRFHDGVTSNSTAAAFQLAVWEISHDDGLSLSSGSTTFQNLGSYFGVAQDWLDSLDGTGPMADLLVMSHSSKQDQVFEIPNPASAAMLMMAGVCGAATRRRRNQLDS